MVLEYLSLTDAQRLLNFFSDGKLQFSVLEKTFRESFSTETYFNVSRAIQNMAQGMIISTDALGLVTSFFLLDIMCRADCEVAKSVFYDTLLRLERAMRHDVCLTEQIKYASKETKEGKKALEATSAEKYRLHCAAKGFAFRLLANKVAPDETLLSVLHDKQEQIDAALNAWESNCAQLKESIANISHCWIQDIEKNSCETLSKSSAVLDSDFREALLLQVARPRLPSLPLVSGELQFLLPGGSPSSDLLLIGTELATGERQASKN